jgi:hypothetical protein
MYSEIVIQKLDELTEKVNTLLEAQKSNTRGESEWIDEKETMRILRCSERTLQTLSDNGSICYTRPMGGTKFFYR